MTLQAKRTKMPDHPVKLTDEQKVKWFQDFIKSRTVVDQFKSEQELIEFVRFARATFKKIYKRDVPGSFIRRLFNDLGVAREHSDGVKVKRDYMFGLMDRNKSYRENKTQVRKAVIEKFGESILGIVFDELWDEYHSIDDHPTPEVDIDIYGQESLFGD